MTRRIDYAPIDCPANPQAAAARAAMREYAAQMKGEPLAPEPTPEDTLIERVLQHWPDMVPYADTAIIEQLYDAQRDTWRDCVTVTVFEREK